MDLGRETEIGRTVVMELGYRRTQRFAIEYKAGDEWRALHRGTTIAGTRVYDFPAVSARYVRLNILGANEVPTIEEFQVYPPGASLPEPVAQAQRQEEERIARLEWFHEAKYGLFINWGLYSIPAGEWRGKPIRGVKLCFYYSQAQDWHEPNGAGNAWDFVPDPQKDFDQYLRGKSLPQVRELLSNYGPIGLIWFDTPRLMTPERSKQFADLVRSIQPDTLINSRLGPGGYNDYRSRGDNEIPYTVTPGAWGTAATINNTWGYKKDDHNWKPAEDICFKLVDIVSKGGNYLLNVGPTATGSSRSRARTSCAKSAPG